MARIWRACLFYMELVLMSPLNPPMMVLSVWQTILPHPFLIEYSPCPDMGLLGSSFP